MKISKCKVIWSIKSRIFKQKTVLTKISLNSHSTKKRSWFRHPYRFMNLDFLGHFGILVNRSFSSALGSMTFLTFGTYVITCCHPRVGSIIVSKPIFEFDAYYALQEASCPPSSAPVCIKSLYFNIKWK